MNEENKTIKTGWREWVALPELGIPAIKAKVDTGAKTSALHTFNIEPFTKNNREYIKFKLHPLQKNTDLVIECVSPVLDKRVVKDSGGHAEERFVILTPIRLGELVIPIEITLTNREDMQFRMLLGRSALTKANIDVVPSQSYKLGRNLKQAYN
ncbi:MAG: hypothetical protein ACI9ZT_001715 [Gammaproteobacteria bacterium]|jgi:hypothetical protein